MNAQTTPEITMIEQTEAHEAHETPIKPIAEYALLGTVLQAIDGYIKALVEKEFARLVESHRTLALMDENMKTAIAEMIDDRVCDHEDSHEHWTEDAIDSNIGAYLDGYMRNSTDYITENRVMEILRDTMSEEIDEIVERKLDGASISISL